VTGDHTTSAELADFAARLRVEDLPPNVVHQAVRCLVDFLGCTLAGSATDEAARVRAGIAALEPGDVATAPRANPPTVRPGAIPHHGGCLPDVTTLA